jgi:hypothetical protein
MKKSKYGLLILLLLLVTFCNQMTTGQSVVALKLPGMEDAIVKKDITYLNNSVLNRKMDIYYPPKFDFKRNIPAIIFISGCPDTSMVKLAGNEFRKWSTYTSWCKLVAASGMAAIVYETGDPKDDLIALTEYINSNLDKLSINKNSIGAFVCSGHTPNAVSYILNSPSNIFNCAVLYYGFFLTQDFEYLSTIEGLLIDKGFQKPPILTDPINWNKNVSILIIRAGMDNVPYLNQSMQNFFNNAIKQNLPITLINYPQGVHGFDVYTDNETTRLIISNTLEFWKQNLKVNSN